MEYVGARGSFTDLPLKEILTAFEKEYGDSCFVPRRERDRDELFDAPELLT
jgi:hypothetical protein